MKKAILTFGLFSFTFLLSGQGNTDTGNQGAGGNKKLDGITAVNKELSANAKLNLTLSIDTGNQGAGGNKKLDY
ncbi:hypothetical protein GGR22_001260 [Flavobacterium gossypii]|mgnify:CR=1 FL=1|uniref:Uncharacterized protein n=1 Tax=Flavobacterium gossypii TaxID=1646119 RepID=A0ABR6DN76_9FLAO|nr:MULTISPECIES: hypothetical protein [Flavobacterium]MBA9073134.1 hypothetical protein [Flavobacterium gossypii]WDO13589.1 hypothetical protein MH928_02545 [Flavobacterium sp. WW92]